MKLIQCKACDRPISPLAEACPQCGAPNSWRHPLIDAFYVAKDAIGTSRPFTFRSNKTKIWGETKAQAPLRAKLFAALVLVVVGLPAIAIWGIVGAFVAGAMSVVPIIVMGRSEKFSADLDARTWTSSNDVFWRPVKEKLQL